MQSVGLDIHKVNTQVCILAVDGTVEREVRIATDRKHLAKLLGSRAPMRMLLEASTESEWVARFLETLGHEVIVADPNYAPMYPHRVRRVKTDRRDARALAEACRSGTFRRAHRASEASRRTRAGLAVREALVRTRSRYISVVRSLLRGEGMRVRSGDASTFASRVEELELPEVLASTVAPLLEIMETLSARLQEIDRDLAAATREDPVTATVFRTVIDDVTRFRSAHLLESYLGLVPGERSSGETRHRGHLTKRGNTRARWLLIEAAWTILRGKAANTHELAAWGRQIAARRGKQIGAVALARKLAGILFAMWRDGKDFDPTKIRTRTRKVELCAA